MASDKDYCTVLDKLDDKAVLFVTKNCLSTIVGNPQRKVTVFVPADGFKNSDDFKAHVCGRDWSIEALKEFAKTADPFLVSKGAPGDTRYKYAVKISGNNVSVGGITLGQGVTVKNGVIYKLKKGERLDTSEVFDESSVVKRKGSKKGSKDMEGGAFPPIMSTAAWDEHIMGYELRNRIIGEYMALYPLNNCPLDSPICWPNALWSNFCNYAYNCPSLGLGWLQNIAPVVGVDYYANVQTVLQPTMADLTSYLVPDPLLRGFGMSPYYLAKDIASELEMTHQILQMLPMTITGTYPGGLLAPRVYLGGINEMQGGDLFTMDLIPALVRLREQIKTHVTIPCDTIKKFFCTPDDCGTKQGPIDPVIRYISKCAFERVYGYDVSIKTSLNSLSTEINFSDVLTGIIPVTLSECTDTINMIYFAAEILSSIAGDINIQVKGISIKQFESIQNYNTAFMADKDLVQLQNNPYFSKEMYFILLVGISLTIYIRGAENCANIFTILKDSPLSFMCYYTADGNRESQAGLYNGIRFSQNFKFDECDVYSLKTIPKKEYMAYPIDTLQMFWGPTNFYLMVPQVANAYVTVLLCILKESVSKESPFGDIFTSGIFYDYCLNQCKIGTFGFPTKFERVFRQSQAFCTHVPHGLYKLVYKHVWDDLKNKDLVTCGKNILSGILTIYNCLVDEITLSFKEAESGYINKPLNFTSYPWFLRKLPYKRIVAGDGLTAEKSMAKVLNDLQLSHFVIDPKINIFNYLESREFDNAVNALHVLEPSGNLTMTGGGLTTAQIPHYSLPGVMYRRGVYPEIVTKSRAKWSQNFHKLFNKSFSGGCAEVLKIYDVFHHKKNGFLGNHYQGLYPLNADISTTMFYSDFMRFVGGKQIAGGSSYMIGNIYPNIFPGNIDLAVKNLLNNNTSLDTSVIEAFVDSKYFLYNASSELDKAPRVTWDVEHPSHVQSKHILS